MGIYEVLRVTDAVRDAIRDGKSDSEIHALALKD
jgi:type II secretory ATPase GspE/PulE/Tfp pilus assembly ATPase PilB-like protein